MWQTPLLGYFKKLPQKPRIHPDQKQPPSISKKDANFSDNESQMTFDFQVMVSIF